MNPKFRIAVQKHMFDCALLILCFAIALGILLIPRNSSKPTTASLSDYSSVSAICEFATLRSFYHNVVMYEEEPEGFNQFANDVLVWPFGGYTKFGYKQYWLEYSGIVEVGIEANQVQIIGPDKDGIVKVYVPEAKVFNVTADEATLTEPISETGWFTTISGEEKLKAFASAQKVMRDEAEQDQDMLTRAKENAKKLLEKYIVNMGREMGCTYTVVWLNALQSMD